MNDESHTHTHRKRKREKKIKDTTTTIKMETWNEEQYEKVKDGKESRTQTWKTHDHNHTNVLWYHMF